MSKLFNLSEAEKTLVDASQKYYSTGDSPLSDAEYDALEADVLAANPESRVGSIGHGYDVYQDTTPGDKVRHRYATVGSLDKIHNFKELPKNFRYLEADASVKLDGLSVALYYEDGVFRQAVTRGNGTIGIDITNKIETILEEPSKKIEGFTGAIRGEILMSLESFRRFQELNPEAPNPRNAAAGLINRKEWSSELASFLDIVVYQIIGDKTGIAGLNRTTHYDWLHRHFKHVARHKIVMLDEDLDQHMIEFRNESFSAYPSDGVVLTLPKCLYDSNRKSIQYIAVAYKFPAEEKETTVVNIEWNMSKTGYAIPRIEVEPVQLAGTTVKHAAGFNATFIVKEGINVGARVKIAKMGEIIPNITSVLEPVHAELPKTCPSCGTLLKGSGVHLVCENRMCPNRILQDTLVWMQTLSPVDGIGETLIETLLDKLIVTGDKSIECIMNYGKLLENNKLSIQESKFVRMWNHLFEGPFDLDTAIRALNIPRLGDKTSVKLAAHPEIVKQLLQKSSVVSILSIIGDTLGVADTKSIIDNFDKFKRLKFIEDKIRWNAASSELKPVAITGKLSMKRADFEKLLQQHGFIAGGVGKSTVALITDEANGTSTKHKQAEKYGIPKLTESQFRELYNI